MSAARPWGHRTRPWSRRSLMARAVPTAKGVPSASSVPSPRPGRGSHIRTRPYGDEPAGHTDTSEE